MRCPILVERLSPFLGSVHPMLQVFIRPYAQCFQEFVDMLEIACDRPRMTSFGSRHFQKVHRHVSCDFRIDARRDRKRLSRI